jgi:diaminohydroxyphosphoribosylaminopyrimidine deaminase/5-amino-6-(5-phosphoribosylamino)uracil reductase
MKAHWGEFEERMMRECLRLASKGMGKVSPNPLVGAVLVRDNRIVARGYHRQFGGLHAEAECLRKAKGDLSHATLYVNLEPCSHYGKTPPCADVVVERGVGNVVVAMKDPNPLVSGRGLDVLKRGGVRVRVGLLNKEARELNRFFVLHIRARRPYFHLKVAQTLDGKIAPSKASQEWISSRESRTLVHKWRSEYDAILVGAGTIRADDPLLTTRLIRGRNPDVVILDGNCSVPVQAQVFKAGTKRRIFVCVHGNVLLQKKEKIRRLMQRGVTILSFSGRENINLKVLASELYKQNIGSVLVEGGQDVFTQFLQSDLVDEMSMFISPKLMHGGISLSRDGDGRSAPGRKAELVTIRTVGDDVLVHCTFGMEE